MKYITLNIWPNLNPTKLIRIKEIIMYFNLSNKVNNHYKINILHYLKHKHHSSTYSNSSYEILQNFKPNSFTQCMNEY